MTNTRIAILSTAALFLCACSANRATEVSSPHAPPAPAVVQADAHGWIYLEFGQKLQIVGRAPFHMEWLFGADPCVQPMRYGKSKTMSTADCTVDANASGAYAFQIEGQPGPPSFVRVGRCETKTPVPVELVQARLRAKQPIRVASVALGCRDGKAQAVPEELQVSRDEFVSWTRLGSRPQWTATFADDAACGNARLSENYALCVVGAATTAQTYSITLEGCPQSGSAKLVPAK